MIYFGGEVVIMYLYVTKMTGKYLRVTKIIMVTTNISLP